MEHSNSAARGQQNEIVPNWDEENGRPVWGERTYALASKIVHGFGFIRQGDHEDVLHDFATDKNPNLEGFEGKSKFSTWLYSCLFYFAVDWGRARYKTRWKEPPEFEPLDKPHADGKPRQYARKENQYHPLEFMLSRPFWRMLAARGDEQANRVLSYIESHAADCAACAAYVHDKKKWGRKIRVADILEIGFGYKPLGEKAMTTSLTETKKQRVCGNCGEVGHNKRTCKRKS